ncbi:unnamed protein product [Alopecurus aequalis]
MDEVVSASANSQTSVGDAAADQPMNVYVWDMDETLILLKSLLDGSFAGHFEGLKDHEKGTKLGKRWENIILELCDEHFFYEEIENYNEPYLNALYEYDDGKNLTKYDFEADCFSSPYDDVNKRKLAYRQRAIGEKYAKGLENILDHHMVKVWNDLYSSTDVFTDGWLSSGLLLVWFHKTAALWTALCTLNICAKANRACQRGIEGLSLMPSLSQPHKLLEEALGKSTTEPAGKPSIINCIVTSGSLVPSIAKCLLYRLDDVISSDNVYSSWEVGKLQCFKWIKERYGGPNVRFCAIGDGHEECSAASIMKWPFVKIEIRPDAPHRFPGLSLSTIHGIMDTVYGSSSKDG